MRRAAWLVPLLVCAAAPAAIAAPPPADPIDLLLILDASGSMWGQIDGENKIVIARQVLDELIAGLPDQTEVGQRTELAHDFASGTLRIGAVVGSDLADATVNVVDAGGGGVVAAGRTYTGGTTNPKSFELTPGRYKVMVRGVRVEGDARRELEVEVRQGETTERVVDLGG